MKKLMLAAALLIAFGQARAETCAEIKDDAQRLACYDLQSGEGQHTETATSKRSAWTVEIKTNELRDTKDVFLSVGSEKPLYCGYGIRKRARLVIRCMESKTSFIIATDCHMTSTFADYGKIEYRVDDKRANSRLFDESTSRRALGLFETNRAIPMIKSLFEGETLITRFTPYGENSETAKFNITGLKDAIEPLRESCGW